MSSLRNAAEQSRLVPVGASFALRPLARRAGLRSPPVPPPITARRLMDFLAPAIVRQSGPLEALTVKASGALALHPSGVWSFKGQAHEAGFVGNIYALGFAIDVRDDEGRVLSDRHEKQLHGTVDPGGSRNDDFQIDHFDQRIVDRWEEFHDAKVVFSLHASTAPLQAFALVGETLAAALGVLFVANLITGLYNGTIEWGGVSPPDPAPLIDWGE
jgi:hypothetical protein